MSDTLWRMPLKEKKKPKKQLVIVTEKHSVSSIRPTKAKQAGELAHQSPIAI